MAELQPVAGPRSPFEGRGGKVIAAVVIGIAVAIVKPWGATGDVAPTPTGSPETAVVIAPSPSRVRIYDFRAFGPIEPKARWEIWPAGRLISFSFAMRVQEDRPTTAPTPSASPSGTSSPAPTASEAASGGSSPGPSPSNGVDVRAAAVPAATEWPDEIRIPGASVLYLLGLSRPTQFEVGVQSLSRTDAAGVSQPVQFVLAPSPWPDHFTIVGVAAGDETGAMMPWPPGHYVLMTNITPGDLQRRIDIYIDSVDPVLTTIQH